MKTWHLRDGDTVTLHVNGGAATRVVFRTGDFEDISAARSEEIVRVFERVPGLEAATDHDGSLALSTTARGGHAAVEIDTAASTAAAALGLTPSTSVARGRGLVAAELVSLADGPYPVPADAELVISVDGRRRKVSFPKRDAASWPAEDAAYHINQAIAGLASVARNGRLRLMSRKAGAGSRLRVETARAGSNKADAAGALGLVGGASVSEPYLAEPARLVFTGTPPGLEVTNLTGAPVEVHLVSGRLLLPPRRSMPLSPRDAGSVPLQRLAARGAVRLSRPPAGRATSRT